jgi:hypothetical protein
MNEQDLKTLRNQAMANINLRLACAREGNISQRAALNAICKHLQKSEEKLIEELKNDEAIRYELLVNEEIQNLVKGDQLNNQIVKRSWDLIRKVFVPVAVPEIMPFPDGFNHRFYDRITKTKSPTIFEILQAKAFGFPDKIVLTDEVAFLNNIAKHVTNPNYHIEYKADRSEVAAAEIWKNDGRYFTERFTLRLTRYPLIAESLK